MIQLSFDELLDQWVEIEQAVDATEGIDHWCSALDWAASVAAGFAPRGKRLLLQSESGNGFALLGYYRRDDLIFLSGIEPLWGFASPLFGSNIEALARELQQFLAQRDDWSTLVLPGLPPHPHPMTRTVAAALQPLGISLYGEGITRRVADLSDGYNVWLAARSTRFRRNLRQAQAKADDRGLFFVDASRDNNLLERLLTIERTSWKGHDDSGITAPEMSAMYDAMIERLRDRGRLQTLVAQLDEDGERVDVGYILGGVRNRRYRGLQISFSNRHRDLSIGNLLQAHQLRLLTENDLADCYDMGMDFEYKQRWADQAETSITLMLHRSWPTQPLS